MDHACKRRHVFTTFLVGLLADDAIVLHRKWFGYDFEPVPAGEV